MRAFVAVSVVGLLWSNACSGSAEPAAGGSSFDAGIDAMTAAETCTKQPMQLTEANCETTAFYDLYACEAGASPPFPECTRTTIKDSYCCPNQLLTDAGPAKSRAIVSSELEGSAECAGAFINLGSFSPLAPLYDGDANGTAKVSCLVSATEDGFDVSAKASEPTKGSVEISGNVKSSEPAGTLDVIFDRNGERITRSKCTAAYPAPVGGVAEGRIWVKVSCPSGTGPEPVSCGLNAELRFENCLPSK